MHAMLVTSNQAALTALADLVAASQLGCVIQQISIGAESQDGLHQPQGAVLPPMALAAENLSQTDRDVLELMRFGGSSREIAAQLGLSVPAVKASLTALYRRIGARLR